MAMKYLRAACVSAAISAFGSTASAQVEPTTVIEESQWVTPNQAPLLPRRDPSMYGVGVGATITGGVAVPVGGILVLVNLMQRVGDGFECAGRLGQSSCPRSSDTMGTVGAVMVVSGLVLLAVGIPMIVVGGKRVPKDMTAFDPLTVRF